MIIRKICATGINSKHIRATALHIFGLCWVLVLCQALGDKGQQTATATLLRTVQPAPTFTLAAVGDILLDRGVAAQIKRHGLHYPFQAAKSSLSSSDIAFGNLECPIAERGTKVQKRFVFKANPTTVQCLTDSGLDVLSAANNHTMDCGRTGLEETMQNLKAGGLRWCGAGRSRSEAEAPTVMSIQGIKVAFVGFCEFLPEGTFLRDDKPTIAFASEVAVRRSVMAARKQAEVVVASFHWGVEYAHRPRQNQIKLAHVAVSAGADLVLGHHPHVLQGLELVTRKVGGDTRHALIAYSLGNFVFDSPRGWAEAAQDTMILRCTLNRNGVVAAHVQPMRINQCQPRPANPGQAKTILQRMERLSHERQTTLRQGHLVVP